MQCFVFVDYAWVKCTYSCMYIFMYVWIYVCVSVWESLFTFFVFVFCFPFWESNHCAPLQVLLVCVYYYRGFELNKIPLKRLYIFFLEKKGQKKTKKKTKNKICWNFFLLIFYVFVFTPHFLALSLFNNNNNSDNKTAFKIKNKEL